jgi:hypothetical protein
LKKLRPLIARIVRKIPDHDLEQVLDYLGRNHADVAFPEIVPEMIRSMRREESNAVKTPSQELAQAQVEPPADSYGDATASSLPM